MVLPAPTPSVRPTARRASGVTQSAAWARFTQAMASEARRLGVAIHLDAGVAAIRTTGTREGSARATGLLLQDGREISADRIAANINPKLLFTRLIDPAVLPDEFLARIQRFRCESATFRMNVALSELPQFNGMPSSGAHLGAGIIMAPSLDYMDRAYLSARTAGYSKAPIVEMLIPSTIDDSLAPPGAHVASLFCQHFRYQLPDGAGVAGRTRRGCPSTSSTPSPPTRPTSAAVSWAGWALSPLDLEQRFGLVGGGHLSWCPGAGSDLGRPAACSGFGDYRTPLRSLYMCGSGTHPGGGVTAGPGTQCSARDHQRSQVIGAINCVSLIKC